VRPAVYIPNYNGSARLGPVLRALGEQTSGADVVLADNGSGDDSIELARRELPEVRVVALGENLGFGRAINRAVAGVKGDPIVLLNNDAVPEPRFLEALLDGLGGGIDSVAGVLLQERAPELIDSAGVVADITLMGFDHLHGERGGAAESAPAPLGPTGGAALYRRTAFEAVGGFDERIFLYYEDLDLALRMAARGSRCALAAEARALHAYSASLGAASARKYEWTGWSRGYMLRRYGVMRNPRLALRALACEGALCVGQLLKDRTSNGLRGRLHGWRDAGGLELRDVDGARLLELTAREALALRRRRRATS
jgi:N-acetylglucosaminyl-diphospho-decaprenol L-rhamnosyltransferase